LDIHIISIFMLSIRLVIFWIRPNHCIHIQTVLFLI